jgi:hypothetical protein
VPVDVVSDRMNVSREVLEAHYDRRDEEVKVEQRRGYLDDIENDQRPNALFPGALLAWTFLTTASNNGVWTNRTSHPKSLFPKTSETLSTNWKARRSRTHRAREEPGNRSSDTYWRLIESTTLLTLFKIEKTCLNVSAKISRKSDIQREAERGCRGRGYR